MPTKIALVATLCITSAATADVARRTALGARETDAYLLLFSALFLLRVAGQLLVVLREPAWLPPMHQWHLMPYRLLLPIQIGFLALMALIEVSLFRAWGPLAQAEPAFGRFPIVFHFVLAAFLFTWGKYHVSG